MICWKNLISKKYIGLKQIMFKLNYYLILLIFIPFSYKAQFNADNNTRIILDMSKMFRYGYMIQKVNSFDISY